MISRRDLSANDRDLLSGTFITPVTIMAYIGLLVGLTVVCLTTYTAAAERATDFGILKAIGARNGYLYGVIVRQALLVGGIGVLLGIGPAFATAPLLTYLVPELGAAYQPTFILRVAGDALGLSLIAAVIPVRRLAGVDPKLVFKT